MNTRRRSAVTVPLFSLASTSSWGLGELLDLPAFVGWLQAAGQSEVLLLPLAEMLPAERSPYSAMTSMALDPVYIAMRAVEDFCAIGGELAFGDSDRARLGALRADAGIDYGAIRAFKDTWLRRAFDRFLQMEVARGSPRARRFERFQQDEAWWLDGYAVFRALHAREGGEPWWTWPAAIAACDPQAVAVARSDLRHEMLYRRYVQWVAADQWGTARRACWPTRIAGDLPFTIAKDSADVWARQDQFRFDATVGAPPDAYSATGQDWGLPPWRWEALVATDFEWMRARARRNAALFDGIRLDHLVGLYRTYIRPIDPDVPAFFAPGDEPAQTRLGEAIVRVFIDSGLDVMAEDLGTVPPFVRASLARMGVPGFKVIRWERAWDVEGQPFADPAQYPEVSVAMTGLHDIEPLAVWWDGLPPADRAALLAVPRIAREIDPAAAGATLDARDVCDAIVRAILGAGSMLAAFPLQDVFGWRDRINTPGTTGEENWAWRVPWPVDTWDDRPEALERAAALLAWTRAAGR